MRRTLPADRLSSIGFFVSITSILAVSAHASLAEHWPGRSLLSESDHKYEVHDAIKLYANKVGPFSNPR